MKPNSFFVLYIIVRYSWQITKIFFCIILGRFCCASVFTYRAIHFETKFIGYLITYNYPFSHYSVTSLQRNIIIFIIFGRVHIEIFLCAYAPCPYTQKRGGTSFVKMLSGCVSGDHNQDVRARFLFFKSISDPMQVRRHQSTIIKLFRSALLLVVVW